MLGLIILVMGIAMGQNDGSGNGSAGNAGLETQDEPQEVLNMYRKDMNALWHDEVLGMR